MRIAKVFLLVIVISSIGGGYLASSANKLGVKRLFYLRVSLCLTQRFASSVRSIGANPLTTPTGAIAWYTNSSCTGATVTGYFVDD